MLNSCSWIMQDESECGERCEGNTPFCGSHNRQLRREEAEAKKQVEKRNTLIAKQREKNKLPRAKISKVSEKMEAKLLEYNIISDYFKTDNPECQAKCNEYCTGKTDDVHHKKGRGRYMNNPDYFLAVCRSCHIFITNNPQIAIEKGWSESRLAKQEPTI